MKNAGIFIVLAILLMNCKKEKAINYASFGEKISLENAISKDAMMVQFATLKVGDTVDAKFVSTVNKVCKSKGCWMKIDLGNEQESMVKFKDYGFFVPMNSEERKVVVSGKAYVSEVSVNDLKHFAKDAGKTAEEIVLITTSKFTYSFLADGVLLEQ